MVSIVDSVDGAVLTGDRHELGSGTEYAVPLVVHSVLPREIVDGKESARALTAVVDSVRSMPESSLSLRFLHQLPRLRFERGLAHFDVWVEDHNVKVGGTIKFKRGWLQYVIRLADAVPEHTGGVSKHSHYGAKGWRHCKVQHGAGKHGLVYWDGRAWVTVPDHWKNPLDTRLLGNAVWLEGGVVKQQMVKDVAWPDPVGEWSQSSLARLDERVADIAEAVNCYWSNEFHIKRDDCLSMETACCACPLVCEIVLMEVDTKVKGGIVLAENETRANAAAWPLDVDEDTAAHEFGHHLGNPDEYPGASTVDPSVNGDGAKAGIDDRGLMGMGGTLRRRYLDDVCEALSQLVEREHGRRFRYVVMEMNR